MGDIKKIYVHHINGINIYPFELSVSFNNLSDKEKNEIIFRKENLIEYLYKSNPDKRNLLLAKINDIRRKINLPLFDLDNREGFPLPDFIKNEKTKMFFYPN